MTKTDTITLDELRTVDLFEGTSDADLQPWLDVVDIASARVVGHVTAPANPHWVAYSKDGRFGYVTDHFSAAVGVLDVQKNAIVSTITASPVVNSVPPKKMRSVPCVASYM